MDIKNDPASPYRWGARAPKMYADLVIEFTGCQAEEAGGVIEVMRDKFGTLDGLSRAQFRRESKIALRLLHQLWEEAL